MIDDEVAVSSFEHVQARRAGVERVEQINLRFKAARDASEQVFDEVAFRVDHCGAAAGGEIGEHEPGKQR